MLAPHRTVAAISAVALAAMGLTVAPFAAAPAHAAGAEVSFTDPSGTEWVVPEGVTTLSVDMAGARGGDGATMSDDKGRGGAGTRLTFTLGVQSGQTLTFYGATAGGNATRLPDQPGQGGTGYGHAGGPGGAGIADFGGSGGGGGGAAAVFQEGNRIAIAAGGGGGGGTYIPLMGSSGAGNGGANSNGVNGAYTPSTGTAGTGGTRGGQVQGWGGTGVSGTLQRGGGGGGGGSGFAGGNGGGAGAGASLPAGGGGGGSGTIWTEETVHPTVGLSPQSGGYVTINYDLQTSSELILPASVTYGTPAQAEAVVSVVGGEPWDVAVGRVELMMHDWTVLASATLSHGRATLHFDPPPPGEHPLLLTYYPDANSGYMQSFGGGYLQVDRAASRVELSASATTLDSGESVELYAQSSAAPPQSYSSAGGTIAIYRSDSASVDPDTDEQLAELTVPAIEEVSYLWTPVDDGSHERQHHYVYAVYGGNDDLGTKRSRITRVTVVPPPAPQPPPEKVAQRSKTTVSIVRPTYRYGSGTSARIRVEGADGRAAAGRVRVKVAGQTTTLSLLGGAARLSLPTTMRPGTRTVTVSYLGNDETRSSTATARVKTLRAEPRVKAGLVKNRVGPKQRAKLRVSVTVPGKAKTRAKGQLVVRDGKKIIAVRTLKSSDRGKVTIKLPKLKEGKRYLRVTLQPTPTQKTARSTYKRLTVK